MAIAKNILLSIVKTTSFMIPFFLFEVFTKVFHLSFLVSLLIIVAGILIVILVWFFFIKIQKDAEEMAKSITKNTWICNNCGTKNFGPGRCFQCGFHRNFTDDGYTSQNL